LHLVSGYAHVLVLLSIVIELYVQYVCVVAQNRTWDTT